MRLIILFINIFSVLNYCEAQSLRSIISKGNEKYNNQQFTDAEIDYLKGIEKNKNEVYGYVNRGNSLLKQSKDSVAVSEYLNALTKTENKNIKSQINYNIGNSELKNNNFEKGIEYYKQALRLNPNDEDARYNLGYALKQLQLAKKDSSKKNNEEKENQENKNDKKDQKDKTKQNQQNKQKQNQTEEQKKQPQTKKSNITKENAERILQAINENEKELQKKLKKRTAVRLDVEKDW